VEVVIDQYVKTFIQKIFFLLEFIIKRLVLQTTCPITNYIKRMKSSKKHTFDMAPSTMRNRVRKNHTTLQLKLKKQLVYNCYVTIPWVLQLVCNCPLRNTMY
jgi:hypothetical protein